MKTVIHVNQHIIKANQRDMIRRAPLTIKDYRQNRKATDAEILDADGNVVARVVYRPDAPLPCGAHVWIETEHEVRTSSYDLNGEISSKPKPTEGAAICEMAGVA